MPKGVYKHKDPDIIHFWYKKCQRCDVLFQVSRHGKAPERKYCSLWCRTENHTPIRICKFCEKSFKNKSSHAGYCSKSCSATAVGTGKTKKELLELGYHPKTSWKELIKKVCGSCEICGYNDEPGILQIHHIDRNSNNNIRSNLLVLCPNCHCKDHFIKRDGPYTAWKRRTKYNQEKVEV